MFANYAILDKDYNIVSASPEFFRFVGALNYDTFLSMIEPPYDSAAGKAIDSVFEDGNEQRCLLNIYKSDKSTVVCYAMIRKYEKAINNSNTVIVNIYDIDKSVDDVEKLKIHLSVLYRALESNKSILFEYGIKTGLLEIYYCDSDQTYYIYKGSIDEWSKKILDGENDKKEKEHFKTMINDLKAGSRSITEVISLDLFGNGEIKSYVFDAGAIVSDNSVDTIGGTISYNDERNKADLFNEFSKDAMTGVLNKRAIIKYAKDRLDMRSNENVTFAILDLDFFKTVNDVLGHAIGDKVIIRFSDIIRTAIGNNGAVGRFGGDEFMVVIDNVKDELQLREYFRSIRMTTQLEFRDIGLKMPITCSIGIAQITAIDNGDYSYDNMFNIADSCLYMAKEFGRNRYVIFDERSKKQLRTDGNMTENRYEKSIKNSKLILEITNELFTNGLGIIDDILKKIGEMFELDNINIFFENNFALKYHWGNSPTDIINADYVLEDNYFDLFNESNTFAFATAASLKTKIPHSYKCIADQKIYSAIQYLIRDAKQQPVGLISYEVIPEPGRYWHNDEKSNLTILSQLIAQMLQSNYIK